MSCAWFEEKVLQPEVELWRNGRPSGVLLEHARHCDECAETIDREARVKMLLLALGESTRGAEPGPEVRVRLLQELETRHLQPQIAGPGWIAILQSWRFRWGLAAAGTALAAGLVAALVLNWPQSPSQRLAPQAPVVRAENPAPAAIRAKVVAAQTANPVRKKTAVQKQRTETAPQVSTVADAGYYPTVMCDSYTCMGDAIEIRMNLPVSPLWGGGSAASGGNVNAQLLVGEDGFVRGIKFLH